jgi:hypothetical protein
MLTTLWKSRDVSVIFSRVKVWPANLYSHICGREAPDEKAVSYYIPMEGIGNTTNNISV